MKNLIRLAILLSMILSACGSSSSPADAEVAILFND